MAKLEQRTGSRGERKKLGLIPGGFLAPKSGPPVGVRLKNKLNRAGNAISRKVDEISSNIENTLSSTPSKKSSKITEETPLTVNTSDSSNTTIGYDTSSNPSDRYSEMISLNQPIANPNAYAANLAGGSRPMTAMNNPQIDPVTGMPITPGGQANMNPNFIGGMANSNMPTTAMLAQEKYDAAKADLNNNGVTEDWEKAKAEKFTVAQEKKMMRTMKPLPKAKPDRSDSTAMFMGGNAPGQYNNPMWKPAADSAKVRFPNIDPDKIKSSDIYKKGDHLHTLTRNLPIVNKRYDTEKPSKEALDKAMIDQQRLTQSRRSTKCMRVKKK
tara:strand:- start:460 stop:1440 length:981 start_codon:yes stop_codon:yes gene_type:complete